MVLWMVGAVINVFGSILINGGTNLMKLGHNKRSTIEEDQETDTPPIREFKAWQLGVGLFVAGNLANFGSFAFAAQSILAALGSVQFIANVVFGRLILKEPITQRILIATALIVAGCVVIVSFGNHSSQTFSSQQLQEFYESDGYRAYLCVAAVLFIGAYSLYRYGNTLRKKRGEAMAATSRLWLRLLPSCYSIFAALLGAQSVLFSKAISLLLRTTIQGSGQLSSWFFWVNFILFLGTATFWVTRLNLALRLFPAVVIVPTLQISWTLVSIISGMIFYQEYHGLGALKAVMFALGVGLVFLGVWTLTSVPGRASSEPPWSGLDPDPYSDPYSDPYDDRPSAELMNGVDSRNRSSMQQQDDDGGLRHAESLPLSPHKLESATGERRPMGSRHQRHGSILDSFKEDVRNNIRATGHQIQNAAEQMAPPYDSPTRAAAQFHSGEHQRNNTQTDVEMGALPVSTTAASPSAARSAGWQADSDASSDLGAADPSAQALQGEGVEDSQSRHRT